MNSKKLNSIAMSVLLLASTFTILGAFTFFPIQNAEAQRLQLRVSAAERPEFKNHFFGSQIVQIVIDDPGATDDDDSTVGLQVKGTSVPRVHLRDGLWYSFIAEQKAFLLLADLLSDGTRDNKIAIRSATADFTPSGFSVTTSSATSFIRDISSTGGATFIEVRQNAIFPTLPTPFFNAANPDVDIVTDLPPVSCDETKFTADNFGTFGDGGCDWPYIRLFSLIETDVVAIRAGSASVDLKFDDFPDSITAKLDRTAAYPVDAEVIVQFTDFMWNMNPVEEDVVTFVLDKDTGTPNRIIYQPLRNFGAGTAVENADFLSVFTDIDFDGRQVLELDVPEGISSIAFTFFFDASQGKIDTFVDPPSFTAVDARTIAALDPEDDPAVRMIESDPNTSFFESIDEANGSRSNVFAAANDRVASWDYFDIINSSAMTQHDGFATVDREVYNSADRAVFTVTDPDLNLRSRISETIDARESKNFFNIGNPIPIINTRTAASTPGISDTNLNKVTRIWEAFMLQAGSDPIFGEAADGFVVRANIGTGNQIDLATEVFHGAADDVEIPANFLNGSDSNNNDLAAIRFTADGLSTAPDELASAIIIDTNLSLADISDTVTFTLTQEQIRSQVRIDNLEDNRTPGGDPIADQRENWLVQNAKITRSNGQVVGRDVKLADIPATENLTVKIPKYNLIQLDTSRMKFSEVPKHFVLQMEVVRSNCNNPDPLVAFKGAGLTAGEANANTCVVARQIVDFTPFQSTAVDNDGDISTGDSYSDTGLGKLNGIFPGGNGKQLGFDRDPLSGKRAGIGSFRVLDLIDAKNAAQSPPADKDTFIRFILLFVGTNASPTEPAEVLQKTSQVLVLDILGMNILFNPPSTAANPNGAIMDRQGTFSNMIYRLELDEAGSNSSIFSASADFQTVTQFDTVADVLNQIVTTGDPVKTWLPNRFIPPNRLAFTYIDEDIVNFFRSTSASFIYETKDGSIEWDRSSYSFGQDAFLTLIDEDLNKRPDATERFNLPFDSFVYFELQDELISNDSFIKGVGGFSVDATFLETGPNTGTFVAQITMGNSVVLAKDRGTGSITDDPLTPVQQKDIEANYVDIRDVSSNTLQTFTSTTNIRTVLGDVVLDRAAYPPGAIMYVEIHDNDFNTDVDIRDRIDLRQLVVTRDVTISNKKFSEGDLIASGQHPAACTGVVTIVSGGACDALAPIVEINVFKTGVGRLVSLLPVGLLDVGPEGVTADSSLKDRFGEGVRTAVSTNPTKAILPILDRDGNAVTRAEETGPNTGIFEFEVRLPGPAFDSGAFPVKLPSILTTGTVTSPVIKTNQPIQVTYTDPSDESGEVEDEEELATFLTNTARLRTDKLEYGLGESVTVMVEEPDLNLDSRVIDNVALSILDIITDKVDTEDSATANFGTALRDKGVSTDLPTFRESNFNTGVFKVIIEDLPSSLVDRGERVRLLYFDKTPSGGGAEIRIQYDFLVVAILPEIIFDKEEYTPFDEVIVSIISPDSNQNPDVIETIRPLVSSSSDSLGRIRFSETGPNTGIFEEDFNLTPDKSRFPGDLRAIREDGVTVEFRIDSDTVATKSVFVNYHVGQVMFDKDAFRMNERGVLRVIDPDANRNPDTIDTVQVRFWSTTDRGGLQITLRETGDRTGIFEEIVTFTPDEESTGTRLRVAEGDTITAKYTDNTLPAPAALDANEIFTVEVEELFASALIGAIVPPLERAPASEPVLVDQTGARLTDVSVGSQVLVQSTITNSQTKKQPFAYIVQIKDASGVTVSLSWVTGELPAKESLSAAQSWIPDARGTYTIEVFVWQSVDKPEALSPVRTVTVTVR